MLNEDGKEYGLPRHLGEVAVLLKREAGVTHEQLHERFAAYERGEEISFPLTLEGDEAIKNLGFDPKKPNDKAYYASLSVLNEDGKEYGLPRYLGEFRDVAVLLKREAGVTHEQLHERFAAYKRGEEISFRGTESGNRARSAQLSCGPALDDPSRSGCADRAGFRADHRRSRPVSVREASSELSRTGAVGGLEWQSAATGAYHQTREFDVALLAGGSGSGRSSQPSGMAQ